MAALGEKAMLGTEVGSVVTKIFDYVRIKNVFEICDNHCHNLKFEQSQHNITRAVEDISSNPFFEDSKLLRYELPQSEILLHAVRNQEMTNDEIWQISSKLEKYFKDSKIDIVNKQMKNFVQANLLVIVFQALNLISIYSTIKEAGRVIDKEILFEEIKENIKEMEKALELFTSEIENNDWRRVLALKIDLDKKMNEARKELSKLNINLGDAKTSLRYAKKQSTTNIISNGVNFVSSIISLIPTFELASSTYKILSIIFGPIGYAALVVGNAKNYMDAEQKLKELEEKQNELDKIAREIDMIGDQMKTVLIN